jgi:hypothetical protein
MKCVLTVFLTAPDAAFKVTKKRWRRYYNLTCQYKLWRKRNLITRTETHYKFIIRNRLKSYCFQGSQQFFVLHLFKATKNQLEGFLRSKCVVARKKREMVGVEGVGGGEGGGRGDLRGWGGVNWISPVVSSVCDRPQMSVALLRVVSPQPPCIHWLRGYWLQSHLKPQINAYSFDWNVCINKSNQYNGIGLS